MADASKPTGQITDEAIAVLRARIGVPEPWVGPPHYFQPNIDAFRHVAECYGDDNPLCCDPVYGEKTVWGGPIASPVLVGGDTLIGEDEVTAVPEDKRDADEGRPAARRARVLLRERARVVGATSPDHRVWRRNALVAVLDKASEFAERAVHEWSANVFRDDDGTILSGQYRLMIRTEREKAREKKKYDAITIDPYTDEQIDEIDAQYASQVRRGAEPRFWEDVEEGDEVGPLVKGPLTVTDMVCWHVGMGMGLYGVRALDLGARNRRRIKSFYHRDDLNVPDVMQRVHWDPSSPAAPAIRPPSTTAACARPGSSISAPTGWATTRGSGSSTASSAASTTSAIRSGCAAPWCASTWPRATVPRSIWSCGPRTNAGRSPRPARPRCCCPAGSAGRYDCPTRRVAPPISTARCARSVRRSRPDERNRIGTMSDYISVAGLEVALDRGVLLLRMARPEKRNALDDDDDGGHDRRGRRGRA